MIDIADMIRGVLGAAGDVRCRTLSQNHCQVFPGRSNRYTWVALRNYVDGKPPIGGIGKGVGFPQNSSHV